MSTTFTALPTANTISATNDYLAIDTTSLATTQKITRNVFLGITGSPVGTSDVQNITNKTYDNTNTVTLKDTLFTLQDDGDTTKQAKFQLSGITTATTRTYTLPNASSTLADIATAQTFTNKTLTSPVISGGTIDNSTITVDSISGHTVPTIVTVGGVQMNAGTIATSNAVIANSIAESAVTPAKLLTGTGSGWSWATWTPTFVNLTKGAATIEAKYIQIGKTVFGRLLVTFAADTSIGGAVTFTLPVTAATSAASTTSALRIGSGTAFIGATLYDLIAAFSSTTVALVRTLNVASTYPVHTDLSSTIPNTWASTSVLAVEFFYEAA